MVQRHRAGDLPDRLEAHVEAIRRRERPRRHERVAAREPAALHARQVDGHAPAGLGALDVLVVDLHATNANVEAGGLDAKTSPEPIEPDQSVPVTTVPIPRRVKTLST